MEKWTQQFSEMGSRNKKTGKLNYYVVTRTHNKGVDSFTCSCPATMYRPYLTACKHTKEKTILKVFFNKKKKKKNTKEFGEAKKKAYIGRNIKINKNGKN